MKCLVFFPVCLLALQSFAQEPKAPTFKVEEEVPQAEAGALTQLFIKSPPRSVEIGTCSPGVWVQTVDSANKLAKVTEATTIHLKGYHATFYSDSKCDNQVTEMVIPASGYKTTSHFWSLKGDN